MKLNLYRVVDSYCIAQDPAEALRIWWNMHSPNFKDDTHFDIGVHHIATTAKIAENSAVKELVITNIFQSANAELSYVKELYEACIVLCNKFYNCAEPEIVAIRKLIQEKM